MTAPDPIEFELEQLAGVQERLRRIAEQASAPAVRAAAQAALAELAPVLIRSGRVEDSAGARPHATGGAAPADC